MTTGGIATCVDLFAALQLEECASWDDTQISRVAIFLLTLFGVLFTVFSVIIPAILLGLFVFPGAAVFDM